MWGYRFEYFHRERTNELLEFEEKTDEFFFEFKSRPPRPCAPGLRFRYLGLGSDQDGITLNPSNQDKIPSLGLFVQHDSRNGIYPTSGWFIDSRAASTASSAATASTGAWIWNPRYIRMPDWAKSIPWPSPPIFPPPPANWVDNPPYDQFFIGGTNSVRGWSLGSRRAEPMADHGWSTGSV